MSYSGSVKTQRLSFISLYASVLMAVEEGRGSRTIMLTTLDGSCVGPAARVTTAALALWSSAMTSMGHTGTSGSDDGEVWWCSGNYFDKLEI